MPGGYFKKLWKAFHKTIKEAKQYLQLGKCQCNSLDSQIGATTLAMMQYIMLILYKQMHCRGNNEAVFTTI